MSRLTLARSAGFCYGVRRAVTMAEEAAQSGRPCVMLGHIIHNGSVIEQLEKAGVQVVHSVEEVPTGAAVIIRSHGEGRAVYERLQERGAEIIDTTCPNVSHIHRLVSQAEEEGRIPVIIGTPTHPEVEAIAGWCRNPVVLSGAAYAAHHHGFPDHLDPKEVEFVSRKSKKRVYKFKNF